MADVSKYETFLTELSSLEKIVNKFAQDHQQMMEQVASLSRQVDELRRENDFLRKKVKENSEENTIPLKNQLNNIEMLSKEDKENLKNKIDELISKLDYHLRS